MGSVIFCTYRTISIVKNSLNISIALGCNVVEKMLALGIVWNLSVSPIKIIKLEIIIKTSHYSAL